ncbi:unnamed protein product, partial [Effrenium voratum]
MLNAKGSMAPKQSKQEAPDAGNRVRSVSYRENYLSGCQRPWVTKDGSWTVKSVDGLDFAKFTKTLTGTSDELRAKPSNGISEMAKTLVDATKDLRDFQEAGLVGDGLDGLLTALEKRTAALDVLNSFGSEVSRSLSHVQAASTDVVELLQRLGSRADARDLICDMRRSSVRLAHLAQWLHAGMSAACDPRAYAEDVPRHSEQHGADALKDLAKTPSAKRLAKFWTMALMEKQTQSGAGTSKPAVKRRYAGMK